MNNDLPLTSLNNLSPDTSDVEAEGGSRYSAGDRFACHGDGVMVNIPEYIKPQDLHDVLANAGRLVGVGDFRPTYGRFLVRSFDVGLS